MSLGRWIDPLVRELFTKAYPNYSHAFDDLIPYDLTSEFEREIKYNAVMWWKLTISEEERRDPSNFDEINRSKLWLLKNFPLYVQNVYRWRQSNHGHVTSDEWRELERALNR